MAEIGRFNSFLGVFLVVLVCYVGENEVIAKPKPCFFDWYSDLYDYATSDDYYDENSDKKPNSTANQAVAQAKPGQQAVAVATVTTTPAPGKATTAKAATTTAAAKTTAKAGTTAKPGATTAKAATTTKKK